MAWLMRGSAKRKKIKTKKYIKEEMRAFTKAPFLTLIPP
jgi:hypothetical protein